MFPFPQLMSYLEIQRPNISPYHLRQVPVCVPLLVISVLVVCLLSFSKETFRNLLSSISNALSIKKTQLILLRGG